LKKQIPILFVFLLLCCHVASGQDIHFTQFYATPQTLNPALTGVSEGTYRATAIYRNQWSAVSIPYVTYGGSFDIRILQNKLKRDLFGIGINLNADKSGTGKLFFMQVIGTIAYNKALDKEGKHYIGLGIQGGYVQKGIKYNLLSFPTQFNGTDFDLGLSNNESFTASNTSYVDLNAGLLWHSQFGEKIRAFCGFSAYHLNRPKETFLGSDNKISMRLVAHGGVKVKASENIYVTPSFIFQFQNKAKEILFGTGVEYHTDVKNIPMIFGLGGWYRLKDAGSVTALVEIKRIRLGLAYDINSSKLKPASNNRGGFEIALTYVGLIGGAKALKPIQVPCPML
jgi:type IX secretion system PorP/SprF family membrane protein